MAEKWVTNMFVLNVIAIAQFCFLGDIYTIPRDAAYLTYTGNQKKKKVEINTVSCRSYR